MMVTECDFGGISMQHLQSHGWESPVDTPVR